MHIVILASNSELAMQIRAALDDTADRYTDAAAWSDVVAHLKSDRPDLIVVERAVLAQTKLSTLNTLIEPGRWPPLLLVDAPTDGARDEINVLRRLNQVVPDRYQIGDLHVDIRKRRARLGEHWVTLPPIQYRLLLALAKRAGEVVNCQELLRAGWGYEAGETEARELIKVHIRQIRRRLGLDPEKRHYIRSVRGFGYMLAAPEDD